jgi:hypothetical protein
MNNVLVIRGLERRWENDPATLCLSQEVLEYLLFSFLHNDIKGSSVIVG